MPGGNGCARPAGARDEGGCPFYEIVCRDSLAFFGLIWQLVEACGLEESPRHLIRDRDQIYGERFSRQARTLGIREAVIAQRSPWQNAYAEQRDWIDSP